MVDKSLAVNVDSWARTTKLLLAKAAGQEMLEKGVEKERRIKINKI